MKQRSSIALLAALVALSFAGCGEGTVGPEGPRGPAGPEGAAGAAGAAGATGATGEAGAAAADSREVVALPGGNFYPESLHASADGALYTGSLMTGEIRRFAPGATQSTQFHAPGANGVVGVAGVLVDETRGVLWICSVDFSFATAVKLRSFNLSDGALKDDLTWPGAFCNDMTLDGAGNLYATDSLTGEILRLPSGGTALSMWASDARWVPPMNAFGLDGISSDGANNLFVNSIYDGKLYRVGIDQDGTSGTIDEIIVTPALVAPDGMRSLSADTLLVAESVGRITQVKVTGTTGVGTVLSNRVDQPSSVVKVGSDLWVSEGQIGRALAAEQPLLPFYLRRVPMP